MRKLLLGISIVLIPNLAFACYDSGKLLINIALLPVIILWVGLLMVTILISPRAKKIYRGRFNILLVVLTVILAGLYLSSYYLSYKDNIRIKKVNECRAACIENAPCFCNTLGC
jgi:hypothetical protein